MTQPCVSPTENRSRLRALGCGQVPRAISIRAQSTLEYSLFAAVVASALIAMSVYVRRSIQANLKTLEDQVNAQALR